MFKKRTIAVAAHRARRLLGLFDRLLLCSNLRTHCTRVFPTIVQKPTRSTHFHRCDYFASVSATMCRWHDHHNTFLLARVCSAQRRHLLCRLKASSLDLPRKLAPTQPAGVARTAFGSTACSEVNKRWSYLRSGPLSRSDLANRASPCSERLES